MVEETQVIDQMAEIENMKKDSTEEVVEQEVVEEKKIKKERFGVLNVYTSKNNTILNLTDIAGNTICKATGGQSTKQDRLKSSPTVAMFSSKKIAEEANEAGITSLYVRVRAETGESSPSSSAHAIVKSLGRDGFKIISISDITRTPRGGPKKAGGRRGRRV
jgi:small subunit ribosomal protein S11